MIRIKIPFQFKIYLLLFFLFVLLLHLMTTRVNTIVTNQFIEEETLRFEGLKTLFYNLLRLRIETLEKEAQLLAEQIHVREALETLSEAKLVESFLVSSIPVNQRREVAIVTDEKGNVVDGVIPPQINFTISEKNLKNPLASIQEFMNSFGSLNEVLEEGINTTGYVTSGDNEPPQVFVLASAPVWNENRTEPVGSIIIGFSVDEKLAQTLKSRSRYNIGFIVGERIITTTLAQERYIDLSNTWSEMSVRDRGSLLDKPQIIELHKEKYLAYAAHLPVTQGEQGWYLILRSLEGTLQSLQQLRQSIVWVSLIILCVTLLIGYLLARNVTAPVRILTEKVSRIAKGDYTSTPSVRTGDELEILSQEINGMAQTLQKRELEVKEYVRQIEAWNKELEEKVAERTKDLEEKNFNLRTISAELGRAYAQIDEELKMVALLQRKLLPQPSQEFSNCVIRSYYLPNGRTGGDYYDYIPSSDKKKLHVLIADVSGHGTPAAFIMGITRSIAHSMIPNMDSPVTVLTSLSTVLKDTIRSGEFVTMFLATLDFDANQLTYSVAGHLPPYLYHFTENRMENLDTERGLPLGIKEDPEYQEITVSFQPGDRLLLFTDGIIEAHNDHKESFGENRLEQIIFNNVESSAGDLLDAIMTALEAFVDRPLEIEPLEDDVTLVAIDFTAETVPRKTIPFPYLETIDVPK